MCIVCVELIRHRLTVPEAERNLGEMTMRIGREDDPKEKAHQLRLLRGLEAMDLELIDEELERGAGDDIR